jgi:arginine exporter protein ArgO
MLSLRAHALITGGLFAALVVLGWVGNLLEATDLIPPGPGVRLASLVVFFGLSVALMFSAIPLMVQLVLGFQVRLGNTNVPVIRRLIARERVIVFVLWGLIALGLLIAIPAAIRDGAFDSTELAGQKPGGPK